MGKRDFQRMRYDGFDEEHLHCYGCSHSAAGEPWPGSPSYERPCSFCIRNHISHLSDPAAHQWYDGSHPISVPMDCYSPPDMVKQVEVWINSAKTEDTKALEALLNTQRKLAEVRDDGSS